MPIRIKATNFRMTSAVRAYLDERIASLSKLFSPGDETALIEVEIGKAVGRQEHGDVWSAEIQVVREGARLYAKARAESVNAAIDAAKDEMQEQLRRTKERQTTLARRAGKKVKKMLRRGA